MARPVYKVGDKKVPSVTTILGEFKNPGGLMRWAYQCGVDGIDYLKVGQEAAASGTAAHNLIERWIKGERLAEANVEDSNAWQAFQNFLSWADQFKLQATHTEVSMVSKKHYFGGTLDAMMMVDGRLSLCDWKTSKALYADYLYQLAAYAMLWEENFPEKPIIGGFHLLRFAKDSPTFAHHYWPELEEAKRGFLMMVELYQMKKELEKRI